MKKAMKLDFIREIQKNKGRFLSIFFLALLGAAFFTGIRASEPDMKLSSDRYYDEYNLPDLRVLSTLGMSEENVEAFLEEEEIENACGVYTMEVLTSVEQSEYALKMYSRTPGIGEFLVERGRLPVKEDECLADEAFMQLTGLEIGDRITLYGNGGADVTENGLVTKEFKIVGYGGSPIYLNVARGTSSVGDGSLDGFLVAAPEAFDMEVYTEVYLTVKGARELNCYSEEYELLIDSVADRLEGEKADLEDLRYRQMVTMIEDALTDARKQLADGRKELSDGEQELLDGEKQFAEAEAELAQKEQELIDGKNQIVSGKAEIEAGRKELEEGQAQLDAGKAELQAKRAELEEGKKLFEDQVSQFEQARQAYALLMEPMESAEEAVVRWEQRIADYKAEMEVQGIEAVEVPSYMEEALNSARSYLEEMKATAAEYEAQMAEGEVQIEEARKQLEEGEAQLLEAETMIAEKQAQIDQAKIDLEAGAAQLESAEAELESGSVLLEEGRETLEENRQEITDAREEFDEAAKDAEEEFEKAEQEIADAEEDLAEMEHPTVYIFTRDSFTDYASYAGDAERIGGVGDIFPLIFFLVAAMVSLTTMTRMVNEQRVQIGTLKALGYTKGEIAAKYILYALCASASGALVGILLGEKVLPFIILNSYGLMYTGMPSYVYPYHLEVAVLALLLTEGMILSATVMACWNALRQKPSELMRPETPKAGKRVFLERIPFLWKHLNFGQKAAVRNLFRYKKRLIMTLFGIGGCMGLLLVGFGIFDSVRAVLDNQYTEIFTYDAIVTLDSSIAEEERSEMEEEIAGLTGVKNLTSVYMGSATLTFGKESWDSYVMAPSDMEEALEYVTLRNRESGETFDWPEEGVALTEKAAGFLGVKEGDIIVVSPEQGVEAELAVGEVVENYLNHYVFMSPETYQECFGDFSYNQLMVLTETGADEAAISKEILAMDHVAALTVISEMQKTITGMINNLSSVIIVLIVAAGLLAFVVLYNLNNINITERRRELATIKLLGFYPGELAAYVYRESVMLTVLGTGLGVFIGIALHRYLITTLEVDMMMFGRQIKPMSYVYSTLLTIFFSFLVNGIMYFRLKKIDIIESLKSVE